MAATENLLKTPIWAVQKEKEARVERLVSGNADRAVLGTLLLPAPTLLPDPLQQSLIVDEVGQLDPHPPPQQQQQRSCSFRELSQPTGKAAGRQDPVARSAPKHICETGEPRWIRNLMNREYTMCTHVGM